MKKYGVDTRGYNRVFKAYDFKFKHACEKSEKIIAVSKSTKSDLEKFYKIPSNKILFLKSWIWH